MRQEFEEALIKILGKERLRYKEPMSGHTTFRVGGEAEYFLMPSSEEEIAALVCLLRTYRVPFLVTGNGSNLLVGDGGIKGAVLHLGKNFSAVTIDKNRVHAQAGALLSAAAHTAAEEGLTGLEFAAGIPGSIGGTITMNAGAYGGEIKQVVESVYVLTSKGERKQLCNQELDFGYRHSIIPEKELLVLSADFLLKEGDKEEIFEKMKELAVRRREKQPLEYPSAGSAFKRPEGYFAGKLIMDAGLAGFQIGGAQVSEKHCGFIINTGEASAKDVAAVIRHVQKTVMEKYAVMLEPEVKFAGRFE